MKPQPSPPALWKSAPNTRRQLARWSSSPGLRKGSLSVFVDCYFLALGLEHLSPVLCGILSIVWFQEEEPRIGDGATVCIVLARSRSRGDSSSYPFSSPLYSSGRGPSSMLILTGMPPGLTLPTPLCACWVNTGTLELR